MASRPWFFACPACRQFLDPHAYAPHVKEHARQSRLSVEGAVQASDVIRQQFLYQLLEIELARHDFVTKLCHDPDEIGAAIDVLIDDEALRTTLRELLLPPDDGGGKRVALRGLKRANGR
ncbi:MAG: hypothetical protein PHT12_05980 [Patescibacteria group bacterium]|nr:hypothetical protein [Patescibacteria group bacterium]